MRQGRCLCWGACKQTAAHTVAVTAYELLRQVKKGVNADGDPLIDAAAWTKPQPARGAPLSRAERLSLGSARGAVTPFL